MLDSNPTTSFVLTEQQLRNFQAKIVTSTTHSYNGTPCREWGAARNGDGYGEVRLNRKTQKAHRVAWMIAHGEIDKVCVLHHCDNPPCCEELHLFTGTNQDNVDDRESKGRGNQPRGDRHPSRTNPEKIARGEQHYSRTKPDCLARGERNGSAKLKDAEIPEVFRLRSHGMSLHEIGIVFGVSHVQVGCILRGKSRKQTSIF